MARDREQRQDGLEERVVKIRRCAAVVKGGRRFSFNALVVVGDRHGRVACGYGKANEVPPAVEKASKDAQETMKRRVKVQLAGETIPHRAGANMPSPLFEGGQMPLFRRIPKRGFSHATWDKHYHVVNVGDLDQAFDTGETIDADALKAKGLAKGPADGVRILGNGEVTKSL